MHSPRAATVSTGESDMRPAWPGRPAAYGWPPVAASAGLVAIGADRRPVGGLVRRVGDSPVRVAGLLGLVEEGHGVGDDLEPGAALAFPGRPLVEVEPADHGHLPALGQVL